MTQLITSQYYGQGLAFYGNIAYGASPRYIQKYGAWPEEKPKQQGMLYGDWQEPVAEAPAVDLTQEIAQRIATIKTLKTQLDLEHDIHIRNLIRDQLKLEREAKEKAFRLRALIEEEESTFILLH